MLVILVIAGYASLEITALPAFCKLCHQMTPFYLSWQEAPHKDFACIDCHEGEGVAGFVYHLLDSSVSIVGWVTGDYEEPIVGFLPDVWCLKCHEEVVGQPVVTANGIRMSHSEPKADAWNCIDCHSGVGHPKGTAWPTFPRMEDCFYCHDGKRASFACGVCHTRDVTGLPSGSHGAPNFRQETHVVLGRGSLFNCRPCHGAQAGADPCFECHRLSLPHAADFVTAHGELVRTDKVDCSDCHKDEGFCGNCHGLEMPHREGFVVDHIDIAQEREDELCLRCHTQKDCIDCHGQHPENTGHKTIEGKDER
ncbi:MAG: NapC/NirT family cytochrome c [Actinobacteria bacterium]|nr:NapC/NirT family cytochrome c [Actinomycetota bacterium]